MVLHIEARDRALAADYMRDLKNVGVMLAQLAPDHPGKQDLVITAEQPAIPDEFMPAFQQMTETRNELVKSFRKALGDGQI